MTAEQSPAEPAAAVERAFGAENRARLLDVYFTEIAYEPITPESAWRHAYRLLMWIDRTIGLAHCYESDKSQPGRPWYARSLRFHDWLSTELGVEPAALGNEIDWLFATASRDLAGSAESRAAGRLRKADAQRAPYEGRDMPMPGEDPELEALIEATIREHIGVEPTTQALRILSERIQTYMSSENKRKNLVGEGFEDTLAGLLRRIPSIAASHDVYVRPPLHDLPGFYPPRGDEKVRKVDLALVRREDQWRTLVSCKWSVRSDREEQFRTDFEHYTGMESRAQGFDYVLITNEFDPARLHRACEMRRQNARMFSHVVHVNPAGPREVYATPTQAARDRGGIASALEHIETGRLESLASWLTRLSA